ncbi:MAG: cytochrome c3 family protein [Candidatus Kapabacteria bacterium]|nr:cytochrome c3 family protein [Candidatus Kapabacteria bacterium]
MFSRRFDMGVKVGGAVIGAVATIVFLVGFFGVRNDVADVGYRPVQPVPFSHKLHAGELQIQCQYCHAGVEISAHSPVPTTQTCMNCHTAVKAESPRLQVVRDSYESGQPIEWARIHKVPDYVHFNHSRHIRAQIDCKSCHGPVEQMGVVSQFKPLTMGWCLDCHRSPEKFIIGARPISGVFTGKLHNVKDLLDSAYIFTPIPAQVGVSRPITAPQFGSYETDIPPLTVAGIPHPKKAGRGPENCSTCHY